MMRSTVQKKAEQVTSELRVVRRALTGKSLERMRVPRRFWTSEYSRISRGYAKKLIYRFVSKIDDAISRGYGMMLWGKNDTGKTSAAVVLAKEARRRGHSVMFVSAGEYLTQVIEGVVFNDATTMAQRCREVDLLILDDLGKEIERVGSVGSIAANRMFEDLLRTRYGSLKSTVITANISPALITERYGESFIGVLRDSVTAVEVIGPSQREAGREAMESFMENEV